MPEKLTISLQAHDDGGRPTVGIYLSSDGLVPFAMQEPLPSGATFQELAEFLSVVFSVWSNPPMDPENVSELLQAEWQDLGGPFAR